MNAGDQEQADRDMVADRDRWRAEGFRLATGAASHQEAQAWVTQLGARLGAVEAERDRLRHDLAAQGWQPLPADWHAQAEAAASIAAALTRVTAERDRWISATDDSAAVIAQKERERCEQQDRAVVAEADARDHRAQIRVLTAERDRLATHVRRVEEHRDSYLGEGIEHYRCDDGACNVCIADGITRALAEPTP